VDSGEPQNDSDCRSSTLTDVGLESSLDVEPGNSGDSILVHRDGNERVQCNSDENMQNCENSDGDESSDCRDGSEDSVTDGSESIGADGDDGDSRREDTDGDY